MSGELLKIRMIHFLDIILSIASLLSLILGIRLKFLEPKQQTSLFAARLEQD